METQKTLADLSAHCLATSRRTASEKNVFCELSHGVPAPIILQQVL